MHVSLLDWVLALGRRYFKRIFEKSINSQLLHDPYLNCTPSSRLIPPMDGWVERYDDASEGGLLVSHRFDN